MASKRFGNGDHDLLIEIATILKGLVADFNSHKSSEAKEMALLETKKMDKEEAQRIVREADGVHKDHEDRIRVLEKYRWLLIGAFIVIQILIQNAPKIICSVITKNCAL